MATQGSVFVSEGRSGRSLAFSAGITCTAPRWLEVGASHFVSEPPHGAASRTLVAHLRERLTPRLGLTQVVTHGSGRSDVAWGGQLVMNRLLASLDYQTTFVPLAPAGQSRFRQVVLFHLRLPLPGGLRLDATTHVDPRGEARYTAYVGGFAYGSPLVGRPGVGSGPAFSRHVVRGTVVDTAGAPVAGAALRIDGALVFTDSRGTFEMRMHHAGEHGFEVAVEHFMFPGVYEVVSSPKTVRAAAESSPATVRVVLRRLR